MEIEKLIARLKCPAIQSCPIDGIQPSCNACQKNVVTEAVSALEHLQAENGRLRAELQKSEHDNVNLTGELAKAAAELEQVKRERDAAVKDLRVCSIENRMECQYCLFRTASSFCWDCTDGSNWQWRGQKEE